jgi:hypothetical protein
MRVSVLIPTHNRAGLLRRTLTSIVGQSHEDLEIVVLGDDCTDDTERVVRWFDDRRIRYLESGRPCGECVARNILVSEASSEVICWQDDDDVSNKYRIEYQLNALRKHKASFVRCGASLLTQDGKVNWEEWPRLQKCPKFVTPNTMTWTKHAKENPYHEIMFGCDILWELEAILRYGEGVILNKILYYRDLQPHDRVTKVYQAQDDFDERMAWQRSQREQLLGKVRKIVPNWPRIRVVE